MQNTFDTYIIEENAFVREGLKALLKKVGYAPVLELEDVESIGPIAEAEKCGLVVMGIGGLSAGATIAALKKLKARFAHARILVLAPKLDMDLVTGSFSAGADGFILENISPDAFLHSLSLVMLGEKVFPTALASLLALTTKEKSGDSTGPSRNSDADILSERERDIVACLERGGSNKLIARQLGITESTVKVHVKTILRKLKLKNRTQAAIWAMNNGIGPASLERG